MSELILNAARNALKKLDNPEKRMYCYSVYVINSESVYKEIIKGFSHSLTTLLSGSTPAFVEQILRFGDNDIFESSSHS